MNSLLLFSMPGGWELMIIILIVILFFGAKKIPELAKGLGRGIREFKDASREDKKDINPNENTASNTTSGPKNEN